MARVNISAYKTRLIKTLISTDTIIDGIDSQSDNYILGQPDSLIYKNIFPFYQVEDIQTFSDTYIMIKISAAANRTSINFFDMRISFLVIAHHSRMRMSGINATRIDYLSDEIRELFNGSTEYGTGILRLINNDEFVLPNNHRYLCRELDFKTFDLLDPVCLEI